MVSELTRKMRDYKRQSRGNVTAVLGLPAAPKIQRIQTLELKGSIEIDFGPSKVCKHSITSSLILLNLGVRRFQLPVR